MVFQVGCGRRPWIPGCADVSSASWKQPKLSAPIVLYNADDKTPWRFPWDIPIEDFAFGFALLHWVLARWVRFADK